MTQQQAQSIFDALAAHGIGCSLQFSYHERMAPAEHYGVTVPLGPGRFSADELRLVEADAAVHGCEVHIIGGALVILEARA